MGAAVVTFCLTTRSSGRESIWWLASLGTVSGAPLSS